MEGLIIELKPCPFCGTELEHKFHACRALPGEPVMEYWAHEKTGCLMDGTELGPDELTGWNRRAE